MSLPHQPRAKLDSQYNHLVVGISKPIVQFLEEFGTYIFLELEFCVMSLKLTQTMEALAMKMSIEVIVAS
jgi:hypothetical protein